MSLSAHWLFLFFKENSPASNSVDCSVQVFCLFCASGDEENLLQLSAATINAEWLVGSVLGQSCQGQCVSGSCSACRAAATDCSDHKQSAEGSNVQKPKVEQLTGFFLDAILQSKPQPGQTNMFVSFIPRYLTSRGKSSRGKRRRSVRRRGIGRSSCRAKEAKTRTRTYQMLLL